MGLFLLISYYFLKDNYLKIVANMDSILIITEFNEDLYNLIINKLEKTYLN